jgi:hypothetical protein
MSVQEPLTGSCTPTTITATTPQLAGRPSVASTTCLEITTNARSDDDDQRRKNDHDQPQRGDAAGHEARKPIKHGGGGEESSGISKPSRAILPRWGATQH